MGVPGFHRLKARYAAVIKRYCNNMVIFIVKKAIKRGTPVGANFRKILLKKTRKKVPACASTSKLIVLYVFSSVIRRRSPRLRHW